jgi:FtsH-binding integral membrane protein
MSGKKPKESIEKASGQESLPTPDAGKGELAEAPPATFRANTYDLMSLGALVTGALVLFSCITCGAGYYLMPLIALALGAVGLLGARRAVETDRTRLWSWLGIAAGGIVLLLVALCIILYVGFIVLAALSGEWG